MADAALVFEKELPRGKFCIYQAKPFFEFIKVKQTHSNIVLDESEAQDHEADGIVGKSPTPKVILTADCLPIILLGEKEHAFVHAGWRGLHNEILNSPLVKSIKPVYAFIGPHISAPHYEVQPDFQDNFSLPEAFSEKEGSLYFSLSIMVKAQLNNYYPGIKIEEAGICTFENHNFHSSRRNKTTERNWNVYIP